MNVSVDGQLPRDGLRRWMSEGHPPPRVSATQREMSQADPLESNKRAYCISRKAKIDNSIASLFS